MSEKYLYHPDHLCEVDIQPLLDDKNQLIEYANHCIGQGLKEIQCHLSDLGHIAEEILEDFMDKNSCDFADEDGNDFYFLIFDSNKNFLGIGAAMFEYSRDYSGYAEYVHMQNTEGGE